MQYMKRSIMCDRACDMHAYVCACVCVCVCDIIQSSSVGPRGCWRRQQIEMFNAKVVTSLAVDGAVGVRNTCGVSIVTLCWWRLPLS